jgi:ribosomal protein S12 methylthiotransferase accessory factor YcaO
MKIDLDKKMEKVTHESERTVLPEKTVENATEAIERIGIQLQFQCKDFDRLFWVSHFDIHFKDNRDEKIPNIRMGGKGPSKNQCLASGCMEFVERWSLYRWNLFEKKEYDCFDIREKKWYKVKPFLEMRNTKCLASGNNYEEAVLHCLLELLETRTPLTSLWQACTVVPVEEIFPEAEQWVKDSIVLILCPTEGKRFYKFIALQYPFNREFDNPRSIDIKQMHDGRLQVKPVFRDPKKHSPNSGGAAGLNPKMTAFRAMNEIFQFQNEVEDFKAGKKNSLPDGFPVTSGAALSNYETDSITDDIKFILDMLGDDVFVGIIDITDREIGVPVVKLISDYEPRYSLVSKDMLHVFFDF